MSTIVKVEGVRRDEPGRDTPRLQNAVGMEQGRIAALYPPKIRAYAETGNWPIGQVSTDGGVTTQEAQPPTLQVR